MGFLLNYTKNLATVALKREPEKPLLFSYYVTYRCELACRYCSDGDGKRFKENPMQELPTSDAKKLISILRKSSDTLDVTGGEPMLRDDLEEILAHAHQIGFRVLLNTKGIGLENRPDLMRFTDVLVLSIDSIDAEVLSGLIGRPRQVAEQVLEALQFALARRSVTRTKVALSVVATPTNLEQIREVLRFAGEQSLLFHISPEIVGTRANLSLRGESRYEELIDEVMRTKREGKGVLGILEYLRGIREFSPFSCHPLLMPTIRPDGMLNYPCIENGGNGVSLLKSGSYEMALYEARLLRGPIPTCRDCCHIFCHMAISLYQRHPLSALRELTHWRV